jgi:lipopolysaccharide transport system permease protein
VSTLARSDKPAIAALRRWPRRRLRHALDVMAVLADRDIKTMYRRSVLGVGWALAQPLLYLVIFLFVFRRVLAVDVDHYASFALTGVLVWTWFQASLVASTGVIRGNRALVRQPRFPLALLPYVTIGVRLFHFLLAMPLLGLLLWWQGLPPNRAWLTLPVLVVLQFVLTAGLAYPLAALSVRFRDTQHTVGVGLQLAMYLTPIFYSLDHVPERFRALMYANPMVIVIEAWRDVLLRARWPDAGQIAAIAAIALVLLLIGRRVFIAQSHRFAEEL